MPAFRWINATFDCHFHATGSVGGIAPVMLELKREIGFGVDENTSFFYENGRGEVFGENAVTIFDLSQSIRPQSKYFQLKNVKFHYLTQGDTYDFATKTVSSSK